MRYGQPSWTSVKTTVSSFFFFRPRWLPDTQSARSRQSYGKVGDSEQSTPGKVEAFGTSILMSLNHTRFLRFTPHFFYVCYLLLCYQRLLHVFSLFFCLSLNVFLIVLKHILTPSWRIFGLFFNLCSCFGCTGRKVR